MSQKIKKVNKVNYLKIVFWTLALVSDSCMFIFVYQVTMFKSNIIKITKDMNWYKLENSFIVKRYKLSFLRLCCIFVYKIIQAMKECVHYRAGK